MTRILDILFSIFGLFVTSPILLPVMLLIYWHDKRSPFYVAPRMGKASRYFRMIKLRSMVVGADRSGVDSTAADDARITRVGHFVRSYKLDELPQLINVLRGEMSLVGPRPNVKRETDLYTPIERKLLRVSPGVTDLASIVFSDENEILKGSKNPDLEYNQKIRPWKNRLALLYVEHRSVKLYLQIVFLTALALVSKSRALASVEKVISGLQTEPELLKVAGRRSELFPFPPPGATEIVSSR